MGGLARRHEADGMGTYTCGSSGSVKQYAQDSAAAQVPCCVSG